MAKDPDSSKKAARPLCFVVGPIGKNGTAERKHADLLLHAVIKHVLEQEEFGYSVKRADEDADPGMIGDRVISDIINAELVVADLTDLNPNAFYELGIRHATEKATIHVAKEGTPLPFDTVAHRTIFVDLMDWHSLEAARSRLGASARAVREPGYKPSNPITQANASFKMRESEDPRDRALAAISERLAAVEAQSRIAGALSFDEAFGRGAPRRRTDFENIVHELLGDYSGSEVPLPAHIITQIYSIGQELKVNVIGVGQGEDHWEIVTDKKNVYVPFKKAKT